MIGVTLIDIIIIIGICQGLFLALSLQRINNNNRRANRILTLLLIIASVMLFGRFLFLKFFNEWIMQYSLLVDAIIFLSGPLVLLYSKRMLFDEQSNASVSNYHFVPSFGMVLLSICYFIIYTPAQYFQAYLDNKLDFLFDLVSLLAIVSNIIYGILSIQMLRQYKSMEKETISFHQTPITYLFVFQLAYLLATLFWGIAWCLSFFKIESFVEQYNKYIGYDTVWIAIPIFIYVVGFFSLKQPELLRVPIQRRKEKKDRISTDEIAVLKEKLNSLMLNEKVYLKNDLTLKQVSDILGTSTNNISWLLNNIYQQTFYDFINQYRIQEFIEKVKKKEHLRHTILALSMEVGFNSKSTFNKAFKIAMKDTPSAYIKKLTAA